MEKEEENEYEFDEDVEDDEDEEELETTTTTKVVAATTKLFMKGTFVDDLKDTLGRKMVLYTRTNMNLYSRLSEDKKNKKNPQ